MKSFLFIAIAFAVVIAASCKKDGSSPSRNIVGNWSIITDSTHSSLGPQGVVYEHTYIGVAGDHFDFTADSLLYIKEGMVKLDTAAYSITGTDLSLKYHYLYEGGVTITGADGGYTITTLTTHSLVLTEDFFTPDGPIYERITLRK